MQNQYSSLYQAPPLAQTKQYFPVDDYTTDRNNLLLCDTCVKGQHRTIFGPDSLHVKMTIMNQDLLINMLD